MVGATSNYHDIASGPPFLALPGSQRDLDIPRGKHGDGSYFQPLVGSKEAVLSSPLPTATLLTAIFLAAALLAAAALLTATLFWRSFEFFCVSTIPFLLLHVSVGRTSRLDLC